MRRSLILLALAPLLLTACNGEPKNKNHGTIAMGDPRTIVTETDSQFLLDIVPDLQPPTGRAKAGDTTTASATGKKDTAAGMPAVTANPRLTQASGFTVDFGEVKAVLPDVAVRENGGSYAGKRNASFTLDGRSFTGNQIALSGAGITRVQQRNSYAVTATQGGSVLLLQDLGTQSGAWQTLKGNGTYALAAGKENVSFRTSNIRNAVQRAARNARLNKKDEAALMKTAGDARDVNTPPLAVQLKSVSWKIDGKDARGKVFSKELRIDVPL